jgi:trehalose 6-phosphate phosphatase
VSPQAGPPGSFPEVEDALVDRLGRVPERAGLLTDFDGTLASIVPDPAEAQAAPGAARILRSLAERLGLVAVISGRPAGFLLERLSEAGPRVRLVGLYGLEEARGGVVRLSPACQPWLGPVRRVTAEALRRAPAGVLVEPKGASLTLHWRQAPDQEPAARALAEELAAASGLILQEGRLALELRPPVAVDKGTVVARLAGDLEVLAYAGDDVGDLAAFAALEDLAAAGRQVLRVAVVDQETPPALVDRADLVLPGPQAWLAGLRRLAEALGAGPLSA